MRLADWMTRERHTAPSLAKLLAKADGRERFSWQTVQKWKKGRVVPQPRHMALVVKVTNGEVTANDFYPDVNAVA